MAPLLVLVLIALVAMFVAGGLKDKQRRREQNLRAWQATAHQLGLSFSGPENKRSIGGWLHGVPVRADFRLEYRRAGSSSKTEEKVTFSAGGGGQIPVSLCMRQDSTFRSLGRLVHGQDDKLGDVDFDQLVEVSGIDAWVCAALSEEARRQLETLLEKGGEARQGLLSYECVANGSHDAAWLEQMLQFLSQLTRQLTVTSGSLHQRLAHNAVHDRSPGVRLQNLRFLADPSTQTPVALLASTARALLSDENDRVRLLAAMQLGVEGTPALGQLAANARVDTALRVEALRELGTESMPGLEPLLAKLLGPSPPELSCAALSIIGARRLDFFAPAVVECTTSAHEQVRVAAATALTYLPSNGAEQALIRLLSDSSSEVQCASAEALGVIGTVAAVEPLLPLAERLGRAKVRQAARGAVGRIQSRLGNAEAGSLSLADDRELDGAVALADAPAALRVGEVTLVEDTPSGQGATASDAATPSASRERGSSSEATEHFDIADEVAGWGRVR